MEAKKGISLNISFVYYTFLTGWIFGYHEWMGKKILNILILPGSGGLPQIVL